MDRGGIDRTPNDRLFQARVRRPSSSGSGRPMSRQELADEINAYLYGRDPQSTAGVDAQYIGKLERGMYRWPNELYRQAFRHVLRAASDAEIGFFILRPPRKPLPAPVAPDEADWSLWFGMKLAHVLSIVHNLTGEHTDYLQALLQREILMFDASTPPGGQSGYDPARRQALITLATLPLTLAVGVPLGVPEGGAATEPFLANCGASLTACWHLLKGSDLSTVDRLLNSYLPQLEMVARRPSKHQEAAARLASQAHRINGILALHRGNLRLREHHYNQSIEYAALADDIPARVSALISLGYTYQYADDPARAAQTYEQALTFDADTHPLQRSKLRAVQAVAYGQLGEERKALESAEAAEKLYPERPEHDPSYLYAENAPAQLALSSGLAFAALARRYPERGYAETAANVFAQMENAAPTAVPERIKYEIINHQAVTSILLGDMEMFASYLRQGAEGAALLASKQRQKELRTALQLASTAWPQEPRLKALESVVHQS